MAGGGVSRNIYGVFKNRPGGGRSGRDLLHLRDGFEIEMNFDRNVTQLRRLLPRSALIRGFPLRVLPLRILQPLSDVGL